jgi:hypothetical protein
MKSVLAVLISLLFIQGCSPRIDIQRAIREKGVSDGEVMLLRLRGVDRAYIVLSNQTMDPECMDFAVHSVSDDGGLSKASYSGTNATEIVFENIRIPWSGASIGVGYLYAGGMQAASIVRVAGGIEGVVESKGD